MTALDDDQVNAIATAIRRIAHGDSTPTGLEALGMSIEGEGSPGHNPLSDAIRDGHVAVTDAIREGLADIAEAIREKGST